MASESYLRQPLTDLKGVGEKTAALFSKCGVDTIGELLRYYPRAYTTFADVVPVAEAQPDTVVSVSCVLTGALALRHVRGMSILAGSCGDETGRMSLTWFNMPYLRSSLKSGSRYVFCGMARKKGSTLVLQQPRVYKPDEYAALQGTMQPVYALTKGLTSRAVAKTIRTALTLNCYTQETLPVDVLEKEGLIGIRPAIESIHFPRDTEAYLTARRRLAFEEFYLFLTHLRALKEENDRAKNAHPMIEVADCERLIETLPYELTSAQRRVWEEIKADLSGAHMMNRLIQGDVGSGKTIVALLALIMCAANGFQGAIMAPSTVLAKQHFDGFCALQKKYRLPIKPVLLTGSLSAKEKRAAQEAIAQGDYNVIVGTHALFQEKAAYQNLALVVTDEQHRFGVRQREALAGKGADAHVLAMSATPIPRTLAIILYGDLHVSLLDELPSARKTIKNALVDASYREKAWRLIAKEIAEGRQAYVVCPVIEPGEMDGVENVTEYAAKLSEALPESARVSTLHGRMKPKDKDRVMEEFALGRIDALVSTTVIEVGVDVPNATVMLIEDAQRFGLAQLHQLRGRVGRGEAQSYCIFVDTQARSQEEAENSKRLSVMKRSNDGFAIAEEDLKQRGPGELFGVRQSGALAFQIADIYRDADLLTRAASYADRNLETLQTVLGGDEL